MRLPANARFGLIPAGRARYELRTALAGLAALGAIAGVALAACSTLGATVNPPATPAATAPVAGTPRPTEVPGPPAAALTGGTPDALPGELGTFLWDGLGSDAPWLVPASGASTAPGTVLAVALDPPLAAVGWTARWAPVIDGSAGGPATIERGTAGPVAPVAPLVAGTWSLQVEIALGEGRRAAWYWLVEVTR